MHFSTEELTKIYPEINKAHPYGTLDALRDCYLELDADTYLQQVSLLRVDLKLAAMLIVFDKSNPIPAYDWFSAHEQRTGKSLDLTKTRMTTFEMQTLQSRPLVDLPDNIYQALHSSMVESAKTLREQIESDPEFKKIKILKQKLLESEKKIDELKAFIDLYCSDISSVKEKGKAKSKAVPSSNFYQVFTGTRDRLEATLHELNALKMRITELDKLLKINSSEQTIKLLTEEIKQLQAENLSTKAKLQAQISQLESELSAKKQTLAFVHQANKLEPKLARLDEKQITLEQKNAALEVSSILDRQKIKELQESVQELKAKLRELEAAKEDLESQISQFQAEKRCKQYFSFFSIDDSGNYTNSPLLAKDPSPENTPPPSP